MNGEASVVGAVAAVVELLGFAAMQETAVNTQAHNERVHFVYCAGKAILCVRLRLA